MNEQILIGADVPPSIQASRRHRGDHSTACKCPNPVYYPPADYGPLPGQLGHVQRKMIFKDKATGEMRLRRRISRDPYFVRHRKAAGRKRDFRPEKKALYDALYVLLLQRVDIGTSVVARNVSKLADDLSPKDNNGNVIPETRVEPCRLSRGLQEWKRFGLVELPELEWDKEHQYWMPRHVILTDRFFMLGGANMDLLLIERNKRLEEYNGDEAESGTYAAVLLARRKQQENIRRSTLDYRRKQATKARRKKRLSRMTLDDRKHEVSEWLNKTRPEHELDSLDDEAFDRLVWSHLNQLELGLGYEPPDTVH